MNNKFDVVIIGGGLAGLTLALQLRKSNSKLSISVLEKRQSEAPHVTHKVGESIVELGAHYLRKDLGLKNYLSDNHLPKYGFRFFLNAPEKNDIETRVEIGSLTKNQAPSHHIDRGRFENDLIKILKEENVNVVLGASVTDVEVYNKNHKVYYFVNGIENQTESRWLIDASGRRSILKRKLDLQKDLNHNVNAVWFRLNKVIDVKNWSDNQKWISAVPKDFRRLSTCHLVGNGYWVWLIPIGGGYTSIGIVAEGDKHDFNQLNTQDLAFDWLIDNEPLLAKNLIPYKEEVMDFKVMKHYAHDCTKYYSSDRWAITGEASVFLDPFYSPGTDFIALGNTWITNLIKRDYDKDNFDLAVSVFENVQHHLVKGWFSLYKDLYKVLSSSQVVLAKIVWDWATYWSVLTPLFINKGFTNLNVLRAYAASSNNLSHKFNALNEKVQTLINEWSKIDTNSYKAEYINVFNLETIYQFHIELQDELDEEQLIERISLNILKLEGFASELFRKAYNDKYLTEYEGPIDPYKMDLNSSFIPENNSNRKVNQTIKKELEYIWLKPLIESSGDPLKNVEKIFTVAKTETTRYEDLNDAIEYIKRFSKDNRAIAYEGASFGIGVESLKKDGTLRLWEEFFKKCEKDYEGVLGIGLGWAFAVLNINPCELDSHILDDQMFYYIFNGIGYYNALYKRKKTIDLQEVISFCPENLRRAYDHGVGRRLWYIGKGDLTVIEILISSFPDKRKENIMNGIGMASGFVGCIPENVSNQLNLMPKKSQFNFKSGLLCSLMFNIIVGRIQKTSVSNCKLISLNTGDLERMYYFNLEVSVGLGEKRIYQAVQELNLES